MQAADLGTFAGFICICRGFANAVRGFFQSANNGNFLQFFSNVVQPINSTFIDTLIMESANVNMFIVFVFSGTWARKNNTIFTITYPYIAFYNELKYLRS